MGKTGSFGTRARHGGPLQAKTADPDRPPPDRTMLWASALSRRRGRGRGRGVVEEMTPETAERSDLHVVIKPGPAGGQLATR